MSKISFLKTLIPSLPHILITLVVAISDVDHMCTSDNGHFISLDSWLLGMGVYEIVHLLLLSARDPLVYYRYIYKLNPDDYQAMKQYVIMIFNIVIAIFEVAYIIFGAVVLFTQDKECLSQITPLALWSLYMMVRKFVIHERLFKSPVNEPQAIPE